jgi:hypothetical protein
MKTAYALLSVFAMSFAGAALANIEPYPESVLVSSESTTNRDTVIAEMKSGMPSTGEEGFVWSAGNGPGKSRAEVVAELKEAERLGLLSNGEGDVKFATAEQNEQIARAGRSAASVQVANK